MSLRVLTRPRHVLVSIALVAVLGATGVLASGAVSEAPEVAPFFVPLPRVGDRAAYVTEHVEMTYGDGTSGRWMDTDVLAFTWEDDVRGLNGTGVMQTMNVLRIRHVLELDGTRWDRNTTYYLDVDGHLQGIGGTHDSQYQYERPNQIVPVINSTSTSTNNWTSVSYTEAPPYWLRCGVRNALQGQVFDVRDIGTRPFTCDGGPHPDLEHRFEAKALGRDADGARILEVDLVEERHPRSIVATYWLQEGNPYPVQVRSGSEEQLRWTARLVVAAEGGRPIVQDADARPLGLTVSEVPRPEWGIDDMGVEHPYPLSIAYQEALEHPDADALRGYLATHPDAYLAKATFTTSSMSPSHEGLDWYFVWTDAATAHIAWISRDRQAEEIAGTPIPGTVRATTSFQSRDDDIDAPWPAPDQVPTTGPSAASALAWYAAFGDAVHQVGYGFDVGCVRGEDDDCIEAYLRVYAGWARYERETRDPLYQSYEDRIDQEQIVLAEGRLAGYQTGRSHWTNDLRAPVGPPDDGGDAAADDMVLTASLAAWTWPSAAQAAGIAGVSFLVGLLYWLWPLLKTGPAALFSRIDKHDLLDHPLRAGIHQAIESRPGIHYQELLRITGHANGTLDHHLQTLVRAGLVKRMKGPGYTCYFDAAVGRAQMQAAPALKSEGARKVLAAIQATPGTAPKDVALRAGLSPQTVHYHLHRLREAGLVAEERDGRRVALRVIG